MLVAFGTSVRLATSQDGQLNTTIYGGSDVTARYIRIDENQGAR